MPPTKKKPQKTPDELEVTDEIERPGRPYDENDPDDQAWRSEGSERFVGGSWGYVGPDE